jgi:hypothetical protein
MVYHGKLVRCLKFNRDYRRGFTQEESLSLLSHMPHLRRIDLAIYCHTEVYLKSINNRLKEPGSNNDNNTGFLDRLEEISVFPLYLHRYQEKYVRK